MASPGNSNPTPTPESSYTPPQPVEPEHLLFSLGQNVGVEIGGEPNWTVTGSYKVGDENYISVISPDGNIIKGIPQDELFQLSLSESPEVLEQRLEAAQEAGELATEEAVRTSEAVHHRLRRLHKLAKVIGRIADQGAVHLSRPVYEGIENAHRAYERIIRRDASSEEAPAELGYVAPASEVTPSIPVPETAGASGESPEESPDGHEPVPEPQEDGDDDEAEPEVVEDEAVEATADTEPGDELPSPDADDDGADDETLGLPDDLVRQAGLAHLRIEAVRKAVDAGYRDPLEFLLRSRGNDNMTKRLETLGYNLSPPPDKITPPMEYPVGPLIQAGRIRRDEVQEYIDQITTEKDLRGLRKKLARPSDLPLGLHNIPLLGGMLRKLKMRELAWRVYLRKRANRAPGESHDDGMLGLGTAQAREELDKIEHLDKEVAVRKSRISRMNIHELRGELRAPRRDLAYLIRRNLRALNALKRLETVPDEFYDHQTAFKNPVKEYRVSRDTKKIEAERSEFIKLRNVGARDPVQEERFQELIGQHSDWV